MYAVKIVSVAVSLKLERGYRCALLGEHLVVALFVHYWEMGIKKLVHT